MLDVPRLANRLVKSAQSAASSEPEKRKTARFQAVLGRERRDSNPCRTPHRDSLLTALLVQIRSNSWAWRSVLLERKVGPGRGIDVFLAGGPQNPGIHGSVCTPGALRDGADDRGELLLRRWSLEGGLGSRRGPRAKRERDLVRLSQADKSLAEGAFTRPVRHVLAPEVFGTADRASTPTWASPAEPEAIVGQRQDRTRVVPGAASFVAAPEHPKECPSFH